MGFLDKDGLAKVWARAKEKFTSAPVYFEVAPALWTKTSNYSEYPYRASITLEKIKSTDSVVVNFDGSCYSYASDAGVSGFTEAIDGAVYLYSESIPTENLSGNYIIMKGGD